MVCLVALMVAGPARAQFSFADPPFLGLSSTASGLNITNYPLTIPGIKHWWVHTDFTNGEVVATWVDKVSGAELKMGAAGNRPTNSTTTGVYIDRSGKWLTNAPVSVNFTNDAVYYLVSVVDPVYADNAFWVGDDAFYKGFYFGSRSGGKITFALGASWGCNGPTNGTTPTPFYGVAITGTNDNTAFMARFYTNGVLAPYLGLSVGDPYSLKTFRGSYPSGFHIKELMVITNAPIVPSVASNLHYYRTTVFP